MNKSIYLIPFCLLALGAGSVKAQSDTTAYHESVIVVGDYNPVLDGVTEKVNVAPAINDNVAADLQPKFTYSITPQRIASLTSASGIKAAKVTGSPTRLYNNYMRFGLGHDFAAFADFNPLVDLYYTSTRRDDLAYGIRLFHETDITTYRSRSDAAFPADSYGRNRQTVNQFDIFGKYILNRKHLFSADLAFDREYNRYYGFSDSWANAVLGMAHNDVDHSLYAFTYNNLALTLGAQSLNTDVNKLGYDAQLSLADLWGRWNFAQLSLDFDASVHYGFPMFQKYKAIAYLRFHHEGFRNKYDRPAAATDLPVGYSAVLPDSLNDGRHLTSINPYVDFLFGGFQVHAGLSMGFNAFDSVGNTFHNLFSDVVISKSFRNNNLNFSAGFVGGYNPNDWNGLRLANPYIAPAPDVRATVDNNLFAHLRINFSKKLILRLSADNHFYKNYLFFVPDKRYDLRNVFTPYYLDVNKLDFGASFTFVNDEMIEITLGADYGINYGLDDGSLPQLYDPNLSAYLDIDLNYNDKWLFGLHTLLVSGMDADFVFNTTTNVYDVTETLPAHIGIGLNAEYIHSNALSFFARLDNLAGQRYFVWAHYPSQRFSAMLGLTYTFPTKKK